MGFGSLLLPVEAPGLINGNSLSYSRKKPILQILGPSSPLNRSCLSSMKLCALHMKKLNMLLNGFKKKLISWSLSSSKNIFIQV